MVACRVQARSSAHLWPPAVQMPGAACDDGIDGWVGHINGIDELKVCVHQGVQESACAHIQDINGVQHQASVVL
jgi:hypothetical protein